MSRARVFYGWWIVLACGVIALFTWGLGFYGIGVYFEALQRLHGWRASVISAAVSLYYLAGAAGMIVVGGVIDRHGPRPVLTYGALAMAAGVVLLGRIDAPWQLFAVCLLLSTGWSSLASTAITSTLVPWFRRRQGLATTLALTGASAGGIVIVPLLVHLTQRLGFASATMVAAAALLLVVLPLVALVIRRRPADLGLHPDGEAPDAGRPHDVEVPAERRWSRGETLRAARFWTLAVPFALALLAQVGFIIHQIAFLAPSLGATRAAWVVSETTVAALLGRAGAAVLADRMERRTLSAAIFAVQALGLALMAAAPGAPWAVYAGSAAFGLGVGNVITLPPLVAHAEFGAASFGVVFGLVAAAMQLGVAAGPSVVGLLREAAGDYRTALWVLVAVDAVATAGVLLGRGRGRERLGNRFPIA